MENKELPETMPMTKKLLEELDQITKSYVGLAEGINDELLKAGLFVEHIQAHLKEGQVVICKICGKSVDEIWNDHTH